MLTSVLKRWDGQLTYMPNYAVAPKNIINLRRSPDQWQRIDVRFKVASVTEEGLLALRNELLAHVKEHVMDFHPKIEFINLEPEAVESVRFSIAYQGKPTVEPTRKITRLATFVALLKRVCEEQGLILQTDPQEPLAQLFKSAAGASK